MLQWWIVFICTDFWFLLLSVHLKRSQSTWEKTWIFTPKWSVCHTNATVPLFVLFSCKKSFSGDSLRCGCSENTCLESKWNKSGGVQFSLGLIQWGERPISLSQLQQEQRFSAPLRNKSFLPVPVWQEDTSLLTLFPLGLLPCLKLGTYSSNFFHNGLQVNLKVSLLFFQCQNRKKHVYF